MLSVSTYTNCDHNKLSALMDRHLKTKLKPDRKKLSKLDPMKIQYSLIKDMLNDGKVIDE